MCVHRDAKLITLLANLAYANHLVACWFQPCLCKPLCCYVVTSHVFARRVVASYVINPLHSDHDVPVSLQNRIFANHILSSHVLDWKWKFVTRQRGFCWRLSVCLMVCNITPRTMKRYWWNFQQLIRFWERTLSGSRMFFYELGEQRSLVEVYILLMLFKFLQSHFHWAPSAQTSVFAASV